MVSDLRLYICPHAAFDTIDHHILLKRLETQIGLHEKFWPGSELSCQNDISLSLWMVGPLTNQLLVDWLVGPIEVVCTVHECIVKVTMHI